MMTLAAILIQSNYIITIEELALKSQSVFFIAFFIG